MTTPFRPYAIGERPGGYGSLRIRPRELQGAAAWNSLSEYRPSPRRQDSLLGQAPAIKEAGLGAFLGRGFRAAGRTLERPVLGGLGRKIDSVLDRTGGRIGSVFDRPSLRRIGLEAQAHPVRTGILGVGAGLGAGGAAALLSGENQAMHQRAQQAILDRQAAQTAAAAVPKPELPGPDPLQRGGAQLKGFAAENWPWLVGGGLALGGAGLLWRRMADRKREEDEQALLGRMYGKTAELARAYPFQAGFMARCGQLGLTGPEIRTAIEKCAGLSDTLADEWTGFFAAAAGSEAEGPAALEKAAQGYNETANTAIAKPAPTPPAPLGGAAPRAAPAPAVRPSAAPARPATAPPPPIPGRRLQYYNPAPPEAPGGIGGFLSRVPGLNTMMRATPDQVAAGQQARITALSQGATPTQAARMDPTRDVGAREAARRFVTELPGAVGGVGMMAPMAALDTARGLTGNGWDFRHVRGAATEVADPLFHPLGMSPIRDYAPGYGGQANQQGLFSGSDAESEQPWAEQQGGIAGGYARRLDEVHDNMTPRLPFGADRAAVNWAANIMHNAGPAAATSFLGGYGGAPKMLGGLARHAGWLTGGGQLPAAMNYAQEVYNEGTGRAADDIAKTRQFQTLTGERPPDMTGLDPAYTDRRRYEGDMAEQIRVQHEGENARRAALNQPPMTPQESQQFQAQRWAQAEPGFRRFQQQDFARNLPGLAGPNGQYNPRGQLDLSPKSGYNPRNVATWLTPERSRALGNLVESDQNDLMEMTQKLPPEVQQAALNGQLTPEMTQQIRAAGGDVEQIQATGARLAQSTTLQLANTPMFGGDVTRVLQGMEDPQAGSVAASRNPALASMAQQKVETGEAPNMFTAIQDTWNGMDTLGKVLTFGGVGLGLVGLLSGLMGEGGTGSILAALLGGGMALFGANRGGLLQGNQAGQGMDAGLQQLGLGHLGSPAQQAVQQPAPTPGATPATELDRLAGMDPGARAQALFPGIGPGGPQGMGQQLAVKQQLEGLSDQYSVPQLRQLTQGIDPGLLNQLQTGIQAHRGGMFGFRPEVADELLQALQPGG